MSPPRAFLSYSSEDKPFARRLALRLRQQGVDVWFDDWEVCAGESLVGKVFNEGLEGSDFFLVLLSRASARSNWVAEEIDAAVLRRIEDRTHILPIRIDVSPPPPALRHLRWVDFSGDFEAGVGQVLDAIHGRRARPPIGPPPGGPHPRPEAGRATPLPALLVLGVFLLTAWLAARGPRTSAPAPLAGLSPDATRLAGLLLAASQVNECIERRLPPEELHPRLPGWDHRRLDDAAAELVDEGLATRRVLPRELPCRFGFVSATPELFLRVAGSGWLAYDPREDLRRVAGALSELERANPAQLQEVTGLSTTRLNRAVSALRDRDLATVVVPILRPPWAFAVAVATHRTRKLAREGAPS